VAVRNKVLIVEDEDNLRDLLRMVLQDSGVNVIEAVDGEQAVEIFIAHQDEIAVVLTDLGLPKLGGWEAFLKMKEINPTVQGILASGYFNEEVRTQIIKSGALDFIPKPYNSLQIVAMVQTILGTTK
jgi:two-component system, cell cycle sensor histidine kinase and response regulator CckA